MKCASSTKQEGFCELEISPMNTNIFRAPFAPFWVVNKRTKILAAVLKMKGHQQGSLGSD